MSVTLLVLTLATLLCMGAGADEPQPPIKAGAVPEVPQGLAAMPNHDAQSLQALKRVELDAVVAANGGLGGRRRYVRHHGSHGHRPMPPGRAMLVMFLMFGFMAASQTGLVMWKQKHPRSFQEVTLFGLWLIPILLSLASHWWRFVTAWTMFSIFTGRMMWIARKKPLGPKAPQRVYAFFMGTYRACYSTGVIGYVVMMCEFLFARQLGWFGAHWIGPTGLMLMFYGMYFGVLGRDCAEVCADRMSNTIGFVKYETPPPNLCGLCSEELRPSVIYQNEPNAPKPQRLFTLGCRHEFHESCIRGWTIVGKKDTCPFCTEKVDLKAVLAASPLPWESKTALWIQALDALRYLIVWNPIILLGLQTVLWTFGLLQVPTMSPSLPPNVTMLS